MKKKKKCILYLCKSIIKITNKGTPIIQLYNIFINISMIINN